MAAETEKNSAAILNRRGSSIMYAQLSYTLLSHRKTRRLQQFLSLPTKRDAIGLVAVLWLTVLLEAEDGTLEGFTEDDLAGALEWDGDAEMLVDGLLHSGFLIKTKDGILQVKDWMEYTGKALTIRAGNRERQRKHRNKTKVKTIKKTKTSSPFPDYLDAGFASEDEYLQSKGDSNGKTEQINN
tara:strand:- start:21733 stop:22284 length:552 start_codon:yes stop_codon:yes gene_type:complete